MANYKVVDADRLDADLTIVADAIRDQTGGTEQIPFPAGMAEAIKGFQDARLYSILDKSITEFVDDKVTNIGAYAFYSCSKMAKFDCPNLTTLGGANFMNASALKEFNAPKIATVGNNTFQGVGATILDFHELDRIGSGAFKSSKLEALILRRTDNICKLDNADAFSNTPIAKGTGYVYVSATLVDSYKSATNWSTYADQIRAIEDYPEITGGAA